MRNDTAKQMKAALAADLCTAKEQMVEEVKQTDRDACTTDKDLCITDHSEPVTTHPVTLIVSPELDDKQCLENGQDEVLTLDGDQRLDMVETTVDEADEQAVPEVNHSHLSPVADQDEDSTDLDEDKRAIRDAEKALRSLSGDWDGEDDFFSSLDNDTGRRSKHRASKGSHSRRMGKEIKVVIEPTESTEILVNGNGFDAVEISVEESKQEAPQADGGDESPSFETAAVVEDQDSVEASESALKRDDTVEALLKIEQECACIQFLVGQQSPCPTPPEGCQQTGASTLQGDSQVGEGNETTAVKMEKCASDGTNRPTADEVNIECTSIEAQILQSNPLLYGKLECETPPPPLPQESVEIKQFTINTDNDTASNMDYVKTEYPTVSLERHNGDAIDSRIFTSDSISHDTSHIEAAQLEAAVILQEMSSKSDKEAATILQQMSIGNRDGNSGFHSSNIRTYSPQQDSYDTDNSQGTFSFHDGFRQETSSAVRPTTLDNLHGIHDSCKKGNTMSSCAWISLNSIYAYMLVAHWVFISNS